MRSRFEYSHVDTTRIDFAGYKVRLWGKEDIRPGIIFLPAVTEIRGATLLVFHPPLEEGHLDLPGVPARWLCVAKGSRVQR